MCSVLHPFVKQKQKHLHFIAQRNNHLDGNTAGNRLIEPQEKCNHFQITHIKTTKITIARIILIILNLMIIK